MKPDSRPTARELNTRNLLRRCVHYSVVNGDLCGAGVRPDRWPFGHRPCCHGGLTSSDYQACEQFRALTAEEVNAILDEWDQRHRQTATARAAIEAAAGPFKRGVASEGAIACPVCEKGRLGYRRSEFNGHIMAACSTETCVRWME